MILNTKLSLRENVEEIIRETDLALYILRGIADVIDCFKKNYNCTELRSKVRSGVCSDNAKGNTERASKLSPFTDLQIRYIRAEL